MAPPRVVLLVAALAIPIASVGVADAAKKKLSCKAKKEKEGCPIKKARFASADGKITIRIEKKSFDYSLNLTPIGVVETKVPCPTSQPGETWTAAAGTSKRPKVGKSYTWKQSGSGISTTAKVKFKSAKKVTVKFSGTTFALDAEGTPVPCPVNASGTVKRK